MSSFFSSLIPWANWWNGIIFSLDVIFLVLFWRLYNKKKARILLNSLPGIFTSLGILGTFCAICQSLSGISAEAVDAAQGTANFGKTVAEVTTSSDNLNIRAIIANLIPAFSTSIYGLIFAIITTAISKIKFANEDSKIEESLRHKDPELAINNIDAQLEAARKSIDQLTNTTIENNNKLSDTIHEQNTVLSTFVEQFVKEMQGCFEAMNKTIESRVIELGDEQFKQSRAVLEGMNEKFRKHAESILDRQSTDMDSMVQSNSERMKEISSTLNNAVDTMKNETISMMQNFMKETMETHKHNAENQEEFNRQLLGKMSSSLVDTTSKITSALSANCAALEDAIGKNVDALQEAYAFITGKSASLVANYEQAYEAYKDSVQNAHELNEGVDEALDRMNEGLKDLAKTNESVNKAFRLMSEGQADIQAIIMRIEELGEAITTLQKLETALNKIAAR